MNEISVNLVHSVVAAEDARFFQHHGFDWTEVRASVEKALDGGKPRGASTITQQLVRNLFLSTQLSIIRKGLEFSIVPLAEHILGKHRILELYLNVVEWGPGVYGADAAARYYFRTTAARLSRNEALELASILPAPLHRKPGSAEWYVASIRTRMRELGW
jgi:monofunctional biosynthetic peptidoglycan transglycosylase